MSYRIAVAPFSRIEEEWLDDRVRGQSDITVVLQRWRKSAIAYPLRLISDEASPLLYEVCDRLSDDYGMEDQSLIIGNEFS